jgi:hypothetical protein
MSQHLRQSFALSLAVFLLLLVPKALISQPPAGNGPPEDDPGEELLIRGPHAVFKVSEPPGWNGDWSAAERFGADMIFFPESAESKSFDMNIRIRASARHGDDPAQDLAAEMERSGKEKPGAELADLAVRHPKYVTAAKTFFKPGEWYEYVACLNPGPGDPHIYSVVMSKKSKPATDAELASFRLVLESIGSVVN